MSFIAEKNIEISKQPELAECIKLLNVDKSKPETFPFSNNDITGGSETELQVAVIGEKDKVDLPITIEESDYFINVVKRVKAGDTSKRIIHKLENYLNNNSDNVWENSWVRFPRKNLSLYANTVFDNDLKSNKKNLNSDYRLDSYKFCIKINNDNYIRVPISYLVKLSLADSIYYFKKPTNLIKKTSTRLMKHFLNDNTSPETFSFHVTNINTNTSNGKSLSTETSTRYLLTQLLVMYANKKFGLIDSGQKALIFFSPHPPIRQKQLNNCISDNFYRELFMSPCLSGWDKGEEKYNYMKLCHQVLSRSHLNAIDKLRESGIIANNLVVLPETSNTSLANNGIHVSLGSKKLTSLLNDSASGFLDIHEKYLGDLVIKITEHFLPLFVSNYSAAPYRIPFSDFHPEKALGFLPHELENTHLRMIWRRWKKKAKNKFIGHSITPLGPQPLDKILSMLFHFKGDFLPDYRLIDYLACLLSTEKSSALNGTLDNTEKLKNDLDSMGIFDKDMSLYLLFKLREFKNIGFSGFEARYYSLFETFNIDFKEAINLQMLIVALAYKYIIKEKITHSCIPDKPFIESERRQIFFGSAVGIPTFYVKKDSENLFLKKILQETKKIRQSRRYPGYLRIYNIEYKKALIKILENDACEIIKSMKLQPTIKDLNNRIYRSDKYSTSSKLVKGILRKSKKKTPLKLKSKEFNQMSEKYYREDLRKEQIEESLEIFKDVLYEKKYKKESNEIRQAIHNLLGNLKTNHYINKIKKSLIHETISLDDITKLIQLIIITEYEV